MRITNKSPFKFNAENKSYRVENKASDEATVYIYDEISWFGVDANAFAKDFGAITAKTIHVRVNSPGGSVFDGLAIFNAIRQHESKVIAHIDGLAASIASIIVLAADEVQMAQNAFMMIHKAWSMVVGDADDMRKEADLLDKVGGSLVQTYMDKTGLEEDVLDALMTEETWLTADEALEMGFADSIFEDEEKGAKAALALFDLSMFAKVPDKIQNTNKTLTARIIENALKEVGCTQKQAKSIMSEGFRTDLRNVADTEIPPVTEEDLRGVTSLEQDIEIEEDLRDVTSQEEFVITDPVAILLARAESAAPSPHPEMPRT